MEFDFSYQMHFFLFFFIIKMGFDFSEKSLKERVYVGEDGLVQIKNNDLEMIVLESENDNMTVFDTFTGRCEERFGVDNVYLYQLIVESQKVDEYKGRTAVIDTIFVCNNTSQEKFVEDIIEQGIKKIRNLGWRALQLFYMKDKTVVICSSGFLKS